MHAPSTMDSARVLHWRGGERHDWSCDDRPILELIPGTNKTRPAYICKDKCKRGGKDNKPVTVTSALEAVKGSDDVSAGVRKKLDVLSGGLGPPC
jgi:hypothetical protein